jgi:SAM-dependent methyltransferase
MIAPERLLSSVERYYTAKLAEHGPRAAGADWSSESSQMLRFEKLLEVVNGQSSFTLNDYGCGYGALLPFVRERHPEAQYAGFDISEPMISAARGLHSEASGVRFLTDESLLEPADFTVASGIFNVKLETADEEWEEYVSATIDRIAALSTKGFAFNMLTSYSDHDRRRPHLYYANPAHWFDVCKRRHSRYVALLHDYPLWEFTLIIRR